MGNGKCNISLGTSGTVFITSSTFGVDKQNALHSFDHADGGYHLMGCILSAASCNKWWMEDILNTQDFGKEQAPITAEKLGANDVYYLPYLMGERSPHNDPAARGSFIGLRMDSTRADMTQAVLEALPLPSRIVSRSLVHRALRSHPARCAAAAQEPAVARDHGKYSGYSPGAAPD
mgnify:CR=1 FL=1